MISYINKNTDYLNKENLSTLFYNNDDFHRCCYSISYATSSLNAKTKRHPFDDLIDVMKNPTYYIEQYGLDGRSNDHELGEWLIASVAVIVKTIILIMAEQKETWSESVEHCIERGIFDICASDTHMINAQDLESTFQTIKLNV